MQGGGHFLRNPMGKALAIAVVRRVLRISLADATCVSVHGKIGVSG
jgi:hypothetical protein